MVIRNGSRGGARNRASVVGLYRPGVGDWDFGAAMNRTVIFLGDYPVVEGQIRRALGWRKAKKKRCDVLWVLDPEKAKEIPNYRYRVLVFDDFLPQTPAREAGALILRFTADLILNDGIRRFKRRVGILDQTLVDEIIDEILEKIGEKDAERVA